MQQETPHAPRALGDDRDRLANVLGEDLGEQWVSVRIEHHSCPDAAVGCAETSVLLTNAYFVPGPQLLAALKAAVRRSVDVTMILPSQADSWLVFHAGSGYYDQPLRAGAKIYERVLYDESRPLPVIRIAKNRPRQ